MEQTGLVTPPGAGLISFRPVPQPSDRPSPGVRADPDALVRPSIGRAEVVHCELHQVSDGPQDLLTGSGRRTCVRQIGSFTLPWQYCHFEFI